MSESGRLPWLLPLFDVCHELRAVAEDPASVDELPSVALDACSRTVGRLVFRSGSLEPATANGFARLSCPTARLRPSAPIAILLARACLCSTAVR